MPDPFLLPLSIGEITINPALALAPMAEFTHAAFRELVADFGGCGLYYTEMLNARMVATQPLKNDPYCRIGEKAKPLVAQLLGNDPAKMALSARRLVDAGFDAIDINMGCSRQRIMRFGWGLALMEDPDQAQRVVDAVRASIEVPLLIKIRSGKKHAPEKLLAFCHRLAGSGVDAVCLHPRSAEDGFKRPARWQEIGQLVAALPIPVIGNGDLAAKKDVLSMFRATGCEAVMVGRAALIRPWLFAEISKGYIWNQDMGSLLERFVFLLERYLPSEMVAGRFLLFCSWFFRNWPFYQPMFSAVRKCQNLSRMIETAVAFVNHSDLKMLQQPFVGRL